MPTGGWNRPLQHGIVKCGRRGIAGSVTEAQSHDEGRGGRSITGVYGSVTGVQNKSATRDMEKQQVGKERSLKGARLHSLLECMVNSWAWEKYNSWAREKYSLHKYRLVKPDEGSISRPKRCDKFAHKLPCMSFEE